MILDKHVKASLWSYDVDKMDIDNPDDRSVIIHNILDSGTFEAIEWLLKNFDKEEIKENFKNSSSSNWSKKSLNFWSLILGVAPEKTSRFN